MNIVHARITLILSALSALAAVLVSLEASAATITVAPGQSIQSAINAAAAGDTVSVQAGTYTGGVTLNKAITLRGEPGAVLSANPPGSGNGVTIAANNCTVEGLRIENFAMAISAFNQGYANVRILRNHTYKSEYSAWINGTNWLVEGNEFERAYWWSGRGDCDYTRMFGSGHVFRGNYVHGTQFPDDLKPASGSDYAHCDGIQWYGNNGEVLQDVLIEYNYFTEYMDGLFFSAPGGQGRKNVTIRHNVFWGHNFSTGASSNLLGVPSWGIAIGLFDQRGTNIVVENNLVRNNANATGFLGLGTGSRVGKNIIVGPGTGYYFENGDPSFIAWGGDMVYNLSWIGHYGPPNTVGRDPRMRDAAKPLGADGIPFTADDGWISDATAEGFGPQVAITPTPEPDPEPEPLPEPEPEPEPTPDCDCDALQAQIDALTANVDALKANVDANTAFRERYKSEVRTQRSPAKYSPARP